MSKTLDYDALAAKLAEVKASSQGWIDAAVEQQVRRKRAEAQLLEVEAERDRFAKRHERHLVLGAEVRARAEAAEAALPAVYRLALADAVQKQKVRAKEMQAEIDKNRADFIPRQSIEDIYLGRKIGAETAMTDLEKTPTPTAAELMARIQTGDKQ